MCTFTLAWDVLEDAPVAVAANRDEWVDRPAAPPAVYAESPTVIAPRDREAGGTWIGINEHGLVAGLTNRWGSEGLAGERSRGRLVADVLGTTSTEAAIELVETATERHEYDGFYLVVADESAAVRLAWDGHLEVRWFDPGVHVVVNVGSPGAFDVPSVRTTAGEKQAASARAIEDTLSPEPDERAEAWLERARPVLADHEYGVCVHRDGFGTRSSSLIALGDRPRYWFAGGPPCETDYRPVDIEGHI